MSVVTNIIVTAACGERLDKEMQRAGFERVDKFAGGTKWMEAMVYCGAFNYLDLVAKAAEIRALPWHDPEELQIFAKGQDDNTFQEHNA